MTKSLYIVLLSAILTFLTGCGGDSSSKTRALGAVVPQVSVGSATPTGCAISMENSDKVLYQEDSDFKTIRHYGHNQPPHVEIHADKTTIYECQSIRFDSRGSNDPDGEIVSYTWVSQDGTIVSTEPSFSHQICYSGRWSKTLIVKDNDGEDASRTMQVIVKKYPTVENQNFRVEANTPVDIVLFGRDLYGSDVTYHVTQDPSHGTLSGDAPNLTYTPNSGYSGDDSFKFKVKNDDGVYSNVEGEIMITLTPDSTSNLAPVALEQSVIMDKNSSITITLVGTDVDGDILTYHIVTYPAVGTLDVNGSTVVYTPDANAIYDSFTFKVNDGKDDSAVARVGITINDTPTPNKAPQATAQNVSVNENSAVGIVLAGTDAECDALTFHVVDTPTHGTLTGTTPNLTYTLDTDYVGDDSFSFKVNDGELDSEVVVVNIVVVDTTKPVITLIGSSTINLTVGDSYTDAGATASDNKDGDITANIVVSNPVNTATAGTYTVTYNVSDSAGNSANEVSRTVIVSPVVVVADTTKPVITLIGSSTVNLTVGDSYTDAGASASDNKDGDITANIVVSNPVNTATAGTYTLTYNVSDSAGNAAIQVSRTVIVSAVAVVDDYASWLIAKDNTVQDAFKAIGANTMKVLIEPSKQIGDNPSNTVDFVFGKINNVDIGLGINQNYEVGTKMVVRIYDPSGNTLATSEELEFLGEGSNVEFNPITF